MASNSTFVLIHGAWHGGWCYARVVDRLRTAGHRAVAPTLTGLGERSHLFSGAITLTTHIDDIVNVLRWEDLSGVILCGHSYGGFVISGVAERVPERIAALVYLDAFVPSDGESLWDLVPVTNRDRQLAGASASGGVGIPPIPAAHFGLNARDRDLVDTKCVLQPIATFAERIVLRGAGDRIARRTYVRAAQYRSPVFDRYREAADGDKRWSVYDIPCGHDMMLDMPERLAEILIEHV